MYLKYAAKSVYTEKTKMQLLLMIETTIKSNISRLDERCIVSKDIGFVFVPMSQEKVIEFHILDKSEYLKSLGYNVFVPETLIMPTTDDVHLTKESTQIVNVIQFYQ